MENKIRKLHKIDANGKILGRLASRIALILRGKTKPDFTPNLDLGDIVEVTNIKLLKFSGKKIEQKKYYKYSGYPSGLKTTKLKTLLNNNPKEILRHAVKQMLPDNKLRNGLLKRLIIK